MFASKNVKAFLKSAKFDSAKEGEVLAQLRYFITPIKFDLASEIDEHLADRLFRKVGSDWLPIQECSKMPFDKITPEPCAMTYRMHEEIDDGSGLVEHVELKDLEAFKLFSDDPNFTLAFNVVFPINDKELLWFFLQRLRTTMLLTFAEVQGKLEFDAAADAEVWPDCELCNERASFINENGSVFCDEHVKSDRGTVRKLTRDELGSVRIERGPSPKAVKKAAAENAKMLAGKKTEVAAATKRGPGRPKGSTNAKKGGAQRKPLRKGRKL